MNPNKFDSCNIGGLTHLVEAASALSKLPEAEDTVASPSSPSLTTENSPKSNLIVSDDEDDLKPLTSCPSTASKDTFPQRLMDMIGNSVSDVICWLPHGRSFVIARPDLFSKKVLPKFFPSSDSRPMTKYPSFTRKLNRWGFRQATRGPDTGAFYHPLFRRDQPELCLKMVCQKSRKRNSSCDGFSWRGSSKVSHTSSSDLSPGNSTSVSALTKESLAKLPTSEPPHQFKTVSIDSSDESRLTPPPSPPGNLHTYLTPYKQPDPSSIFTATMTKAPTWLPTDQNLVAKVLRDREERERIAIAKTMLYHAYLDAMRK